MTYETEVIRRVYDSDNNQPISIGPSPDFPGNVVLYTADQAEDYYGKIRMDLPFEQMRVVANALLAACDEAEAEGV